MLWNCEYRPELRALVTVCSFSFLQKALVIALSMVAENLTSVTTPVLVYREKRCHLAILCYSVFSGVPHASPHLIQVSKPKRA